MEIEASIGEWSLEVIGSEPETRGVRVVLSAVQLCGVTLKYRFLTSCHRPVRARTVPYGVRIGCALRLCAQVTKTLCRRGVHPPHAHVSWPVGVCLVEREGTGRDGRQLFRMICEASLAKCTSPMFTIMH